MLCMSLADGRLYYKCTSLLRKTIGSQRESKAGYVGTSNSVPLTRHVVFSSYGFHENVLLS